MLKEAFYYFLSFFPLIFIPVIGENPKIIFLLVFFVVLPFFGGFWRQLQFHDGAVASFCWLFLSLILPFPAISVIIIYLILFWFIISIIFIYNKELQIRKYENESIFINFKSKEKPVDWEFCPLESLQRWAIMVQGISKHRPLPVRVLLYRDLNLKTIGIAWETWYEAVIMLNKDFLKILPPESQRAITAKFFGELLGRNFTNLKNEIYWWGLLISWSFGIVVLMLPSEFQYIFNELIYQVVMVLSSLFLGYLILTFRLRQYEYQTDLRSADLTDIQSILTAYDIWEDSFNKSISEITFLTVVKEFISSQPAISKRKQFLKRFTEVKENEILAFEKLFLNKK